jgi:hypothetical protein
VQILDSEKTQPIIPVEVFVENEMHQPHHNCPVSIPTQVALTRKSTVSLRDVLRSQRRLLNRNERPQQLAQRWLTQCGLSREMIEFYQIGLERWITNRRKPVWSIALHSPANQEDQFYRKLWIAPWFNPHDPFRWKALNIPASIFYTYYPDDAKATWFCKDEWDAMRLGWLARQHAVNLAVCCATSDRGTLPPQNQLNELPGKVIFLFDNQDQSARKFAIALQDRAQLATLQDWRIMSAIATECRQANFTPKSIQPSISHSIEKDPILVISQAEMTDSLQAGDLVEVSVDRKFSRKGVESG